MWGYITKICLKWQRKITKNLREASRNLVRNLNQYLLNMKKECQSFAVTFCERHFYVKLVIIFCLLCSQDIESRGFRLYIGGSVFLPLALRMTWRRSWASPCRPIWRTQVSVSGLRSIQTCATSKTSSQFPWEQKLPCKWIYSCLIPCALVS
jgi:hypothetical protein